MSLPIVENLNGLQENIFSLSRSPPIPFWRKVENISNFIKFVDFPFSPLFGVPWAAVMLLKFWGFVGILSTSSYILAGQPSLLVPELVFGPPSSAFAASAASLGSAASANIF